MAIVRESNVTFKRWDEFRDAVNLMISDSDEIYRKLASIHTNMQHRMHGLRSGEIGYLRFLPWHRAYLIAFERELRKIDGTLSLPYWDWENDGGQLVGFDNFLALSSGRNLGQPRGPRSEPWFFDPQRAWNLEGSTVAYSSFARSLEHWPHNPGHNWIGGDMATMSYPNDVAFWLHHAAVDRMWASWQTKNLGKRAALSGPDALLDPWDSEFSVQNIDDISDLGDDSYSYEDPVHPSLPVVPPPVV